MDFIKKLSSAIVLSVLIALPISVLESLAIYSIIYLYEIPYLINFEYYQVLGISFIFMITRNRVKIPEGSESLSEQVLAPSINRVFRVIFVWSISFIVHYIFFNFS